MAEPTDIRGIVICVEFDDLLAMVLARNLRHLREILVVTTFKDERTQRLVANTPRARLFVTDAFYRQGASFNKGLAIEEGFDVMGRQGWIMHLDADILLPERIDWSFRQIGRLYTPQRYLLRDPTQFRDDLVWESLPTLAETEFAGYCQLFHADDRRLAHRPWYGINWPHAGGSDSDFQAKWLHADKVRPPFTVLHLGEVFRNWFGRTTHRLDQEPLTERDKRRQMMNRALTDHRFRFARLPRRVL